ncbi:MAG TPA: hypothetical protein VFX70_06600 [Mycobacteriales bacterium]|nr:hypothetical protein [Mycobacteriales bacterium]
MTADMSTSLARSPLLKRRPCQCVETAISSSQLPEPERIERRRCGAHLEEPERCTGGLGDYLEPDRIWIDVRAFNLGDPRLTHTG